MNPTERALRERYYPESRVTGFTSVDGTLAFYNRVHALLKPDDVVVDVGCGRGAYGEDPVRLRRDARILRGRARRVIGIDVDPAGEENPFVDEFRRIENRGWPVEEHVADLVLADNVLEHIPDPKAFFSEANRILRPGGWLCIRTPNVFSYFGLLSRMVPNRRHKQVLRAAKQGMVKEQDVFPTLYRCNTIGRIQRSMQEHGFSPNVFGYEAEPTYLAFSRLAYLFGVIHQRYAPSRIRVGIHAFGQKQK